jgi:hypothetical protein
MSHRPLPLLVVALTAVGLVGVACTLNPQPLPPGDEGDNTSATPTPTEDPSGGTSFADAGTEPYPKDSGAPRVDASPPPADASADASRDGSTDGSTDAADGSADSSTDATSD